MAKTSAKIVIIGGGFGGLFTALDVANHGEVTLISDHDHFLFKPLLYEYMSGEVEAWHIAPHFNELLDDNIHFVHGSVADVDFDNREVIIEGRENRISYDCLVLAVGGRTNYWNVEGAEQNSMPFREIAHADRLRHRMLETLDHLPTGSAPQDVRDALTFAIVGGGASGVELATKMSDLLGEAIGRRALRGEPRILIIEMADEIVPGMGEDIRRIVEKALSEARVQTYLQTKVVGVSPNGLTIEHNKAESHIKTAATVWVAGVRVHALIEKLNIEKTKNNLVIVEPTLLVKGHENVFALGDACYYANIPPVLGGTAQLAMQQAKLLGKNTKAFVRGKDLSVGKFEELGEALSLGVENAAVLAEGKSFGGTLARQARFALYTSRLPTWQHRLKVGASWFFEGTSPRPLQPLGF